MTPRPDRDSCTRKQGKKIVKKRKLKVGEVKGELPSVVDYSIFFLSMSGPTLSPVSSLCFKCDLSQTGN